MPSQTFLEEAQKMGRTPDSHTRQQKGGILLTCQASPSGRGIQISRLSDKLGVLWFEMTVRVTKGSDIL